MKKLLHIPICYFDFFQQWFLKEVRMRGLDQAVLPAETLVAFLKFNLKINMIPLTHFKERQLFYSFTIDSEKLILNKI